MSGFRLTRAAEDDMFALGRYSIERWGTDQGRRYLAQLDACFHRLAEHPAMGAAADDIRAGYRKYQEGQHVIFYRNVEGEVEVVRVLHRRMLPEQHL